MLRLLIKGLLAVLLLLLVAAISGAVWFQSQDNLRQREIISQWVYELAGAHIVFHQPLDIQWSWTPSISTNDLEFHIEDKTVRLTVDEIRLSLSLANLFLMKMRVKEGSIKGLDLFVDMRETDDTPSPFGAIWVIPGYSKSMRIESSQVRVEYPDYNLDIEVESVKVTARLKPGKYIFDSALKVNQLPLNVSAMIAMKRHDDGFTAIWTSAEINSGNTFSFNSHGQGQLNGFREGFYSVPFNVFLNGTINSLSVLAKNNNNAKQIRSIQGSMEVINSEEKFTLKGASLQVEGKEGWHAQITGAIDNLNTSRLEKSQGLDLSVSVRGESTLWLNSLLNKNYPDMGEIKADAKVQGAGYKTSLKDIDVKIVDGNSSSISVTGSLEDVQNIEGADLTISAQLHQQKIQKIASLYPNLRKLPPLNDIDTRFKLSDKDKTFGINIEKLKALGNEGLVVTAEGEIGDVFKLSEINLHQEITANNLGFLSQKPSAKYLDSGEVKWKGGWTGNNEESRLTGRLAIAGTALNVNLLGNIEGKLPKIRGELSVSSIDVGKYRPYIDEKSQGQTENKESGSAPEESDKTISSGKAFAPTNQVAADHSGHPGDSLGAPQVEPESSGSEDSGKKSNGESGLLDKLLSDQIIPTQWMNIADIEVKVTVEDIRHAEVDITAIEGVFTINEKGALLGPIKLEFMEGTVEGAVQLSNTKPLKLSIKAKAQDIDISPEGLKKGEVPFLVGALTMNVSLEAEGDSPKALVKSLNGIADFKLKDGLVDSKAMELLAKDIAGWASHIATEKKQSTVYCAMISLQANDGVIDSKVLFADTENVTVTGHIELNFDDETMDIALLPKSKSKIFETASPVTIKGTMQDPTVIPVDAKSLVANYGIYLYAPYLFIPKTAIQAFLSIFWTPKESPHKCDIEEAKQEQAG